MAEGARHVGALQVHTVALVEKTDVHERGQQRLRSGLNGITGA